MLPFGSRAMEDRLYKKALARTLSLSGNFKHSHQGLKVHTFTSISDFHFQTYQTITRSSHGFPTHWHKGYQEAKLSSLFSKSTIEKELQHYCECS